MVHSALVPFDLFSLSFFGSSPLQTLSEFLCIVVSCILSNSSPILLFYSLLVYIPRVSHHTINCTTPLPRSFMTPDPTNVTIAIALHVYLRHACRK